MKGFLRRLTGHKVETPVAPSPAAVPPGEAIPDPVAIAQPPVAILHQPAATAPAPGGGEAPGPVFSSRAVRDATVVTGAIDTLGRFVAGQDVTGDLIHRLEALTPDQVNFLQLSAEPGLIQRALVRTEGQKGTKAAALRKLLGDIAGGAIPDAGKSNPLLVSKEPILPPLASLKHRPTVTNSPAEPVPAPAPAVLFPLPPLVVPQSAPAPADPPPSIARPMPLAHPMVPTAQISAASVAAVVAAAPLPPRPRTLPPVPTPKADEVKPAGERPQAPVMVPVAMPPIITSDTVEPPPPVPAPPPSVPPADSAALPRLARADAENRRARLMAALNDHLSANEAAP